MTPNRSVPGLLLCLLLTVAAAAAAQAAPAVQRPVYRSAGAAVWPIATAVLRIATFPFGVLLRNSDDGATGDAWRANGKLERTAGWQRLGFPLDGPGRGLMIEVRGKAEFRQAEIVFDDGELQRVNLGSGRTYDRGLYELVRFDAERGVRLVRCSARARSAHASLRVLLVREDPDPAAAVQGATAAPPGLLDSPAGAPRSFVLQGIPASGAGPRPRD